eukprot:7387980-Prymnesium_polylepis.1
MWGRSRSRRRKRGDGSRGPRTSSCTPHAAPSGLSTMPERQHSVTISLIFLIVFAAAVALCTSAVLMMLQPAGEGTVAAPMLNMSICGVALPLWKYGGEDNESIRFMETLPEEAPQVSLSEKAEAWLLQLEEEQRLIEELPFVNGSVHFVTSDSKTNDNKVQVSVSCCWEKSRR